MSCKVPEIPIWLHSSIFRWEPDLVIIPPQKPMTSEGGKSVFMHLYTWKVRFSLHFTPSLFRKSILKNQVNIFFLRTQPKRSNSTRWDWIQTHSLILWPYKLIFFSDLNNITCKSINVVLAEAKTDYNLNKLQVFPSFFFSWNLPNMWMIFLTWKDKNTELFVW